MCKPNLDNILVAGKHDDKKEEEVDDYSNEENGGDAYMEEGKV